MDYFIEAVKDGRSLLGSANTAIVRDAKTMVKVNNRLKWFNPDRDFDEIRIYSFSNLYDEKTYRLIRTICKDQHHSLVPLFNSILNTKLP